MVTHGPSDAQAWRCQSTGGANYQTDNKTARLLHPRFSQGIGPAPLLHPRFPRSLFQPAVFYCAPSTTPPPGSVAVSERGRSSPVARIRPDAVGDDPAAEGPGL